MFLCACAVLLAFIHFSGGAYIVPSTLSVLESESYLVYLSPSPGESFQSCSVTSAWKIFKIDLSSGEPNFADETNKIAKSEGEVKVSGIGPQVCGFKVDNATTSYPTLWTLSAVDSRNATVTFRSTIIYKTRQSGNRRIAVVLGSLLTISCKTDGQDTLYCSLYNPMGRKMSTNTNCAYTTKLATINDMGKWECRSLLIGSMAETVSQIEVYRQERENVTTYYDQTNDKVLIGCELKGGISSFYCLFELPNGENIRVYDALALPRYTTFGTSIAENKCYIQIEKPLFDKEVGTWRCLFRSAYTTGNVIQVGEPNGEPPKKSKTTVRVLLGENVLISCSVPYSADNCYIRHPNGTEFEPDDQHLIMAGICEKTFTITNKTDEGVFVCGLGLDNGQPENVFETEVKVFEKTLKHQTNDLTKAAYGKEATISCETSVDEYPLKYCRFVTPQNKGFWLTSTTDTENFAYTGKGIERGECGLKIKKVAPEHAGNWKCLTQVGDRQMQLSTTIDINMPNKREYVFASASGIALGGVAAMLLVAGLTYHNWKKSRSEATSSPAPRRSSSEEEEI